MKAKHFTKETIRQLGVAQRTLPSFGIGDTIAVSQRIREGDKERLQVFQGDVIAMRNNGSSGTFTVRKISANGIAVERIYPFHSPLIDSIKVVRKGDVRRAKLYYIRDRVGKAGRVKERILTKEEKRAQIESENKMVQEEAVIEAAPQEETPAQAAPAQEAQKTVEEKEVVEAKEESEKTE